MGLSLSACFPVSREELHFGGMVGTRKLKIRVSSCVVPYDLQFQDLRKRGDRKRGVVDRGTGSSAPLSSFSQPN